MGENKNSSCKKKRIVPQMFDVRPVNEAGDFDMSKLKKMKRVVSLVEKRKEQKLSGKKLKIGQTSILDEEVQRFNKVLAKSNHQIKLASEIKNVKDISLEFKGTKKSEYDEKNLIEKTVNKKKTQKKVKTKIKTKRKTSIFSVRSRKKKKIKSEISHKTNREKLQQPIKRYFWILAKASFALIVLFLISNFVIKGWQIKNSGILKTQKALAEMDQAKNNLKKGNFQQSYLQFKQASEKLNEMAQEINGMGSFLIKATKYVPYLSKVSSGEHLVLAGKDSAKAGSLISEMLQSIEEIKNQKKKTESISYLKLFQNNESKLRTISALLKDAENNFQEVRIDDVPAPYQNKFIDIQKRLPEINQALTNFLSEEKIFVDILGGNGPRKYLFLFQNNQEMRATGGFIGSYGLLDIFNGRVRNFFIDGIYNPDGQLHTKIVPPAPIQKISANWSLHDSNWFPDFPESAEKAIWFYEKTGGPTVDGVITMTPTVMQKLLKVTGPIAMPKYGVTVDANNFIEKIQYEVETDYDKELNHPKKILSDLAPKILDKIFNGHKIGEIAKTMNVLLASLNEKQILIYSRNWQIEKILADNNWAGRILKTPKDYLSVINTNINGFKTDGVIKENIFHKAEIQADGSIIDTVIITRKHNGGNTPYEWWNKVNTDYMRVYVPQGSKLISAEGQTREFDTPPIDYKALGFQRDPQVQAEEDSMRIDNKSGTRIYNEAGKTVFANWVYVSPQETVTLKYVYLLPFKIKFDSVSKPADSYSLLAQKQSGSLGSGLVSEINYPKAYNVIWQYPKKNILAVTNLPTNQKGVKVKTTLKVDKFMGLVFSQTLGNN